MSVPDDRSTRSTGDARATLVPGARGAAATGGLGDVRATAWGVTEAETAARYRCDEVLPQAPGRWLRAAPVAAAAPTVFRRLCQLRAAPYSYDLLDNFARRSPRELLPWCWDLEPGQTVMTIFTLESFVADREMTLVMKPGGPTRVFGELALTYQVVSCDGGRSRLVAALRVAGGDSWPARVRRRALAWGDLVMMRKQLRTLAALAAADERG